MSKYKSLQECQNEIATELLGFANWSNMPNDVKLAYYPEVCQMYAFQYRDSPTVVWVQVDKFIDANVTLHMGDGSKKRLKEVTIAELFKDK